jgi:hypothetical protein
MKTLLLLCLLLGASPGFGQSLDMEELVSGTIKALDIKNGFKWYRLGTPIEDLPTLKPSAEGIYTAPNERMLIGDIKLATLIFFSKFYSEKERLSGIAFASGGESNCTNLLTALTTQYGAGSEVSYNKLVWRGRVVTMTYERKKRASTEAIPYGAPPEREYCEVFIVSNIAAAEQGADKDARAKKAARDL